MNDSDLLLKIGADTTNFTLATEQIVKKFNDIHNKLAAGPGGKTPLFNNLTKEAKNFVNELDKLEKKTATKMGQVRASIGKSLKLDMKNLTKEQNTMLDRYARRYIATNNKIAQKKLADDKLFAEKMYKARMYDLKKIAAEEKRQRSIKAAAEKRDIARLAAARKKTFMGALGFGLTQDEKGPSFGHKFATTSQYAIAGTALMGIRSAFMAATRAGLEYNAALYKNMAVLKASMLQSKALAQANWDVVSSFGGSVTEINEASLTLGRAGIAFDSIASATKTTALLAKLTGDSLADASKVVSTFALTYKLAGSEIQTLGNQLTYAANASKMTIEDFGTMANYALASSKVLGLAKEEVLALSTAFSNVGVNASTQGTQIRKFSKLVREDSASAIKFFNAIGLEQKKFRVDLKNGNATMEDFVKKVQGLYNDPEAYSKATSGMQILTKNFVDILAITGDNYSKHIKKIKEGGDDLEEQAKIISMSISSKFEQMWASLQQTSSKLGSATGGGLMNFFSGGERNKTLETNAIKNELKGRIEYLETLQKMGNSLFNENDLAIAKEKLAVMEKRGDLFKIEVKEAKTLGELEAKRAAQIRQITAMQTVFAKSNIPLVIQSERLSEKYGEVAATTDRILQLTVDKAIAANEDVTVADTLLNKTEAQLKIEEKLAMQLKIATGGKVDKLKRIQEELDLESKKPAYAKQVENILRLTIKMVAEENRLKAAQAVLDKKKITDAQRLIRVEQSRLNSHLTYINSQKEDTNRMNARIAVMTTFNENEKRATAVRAEAAKTIAKAQNQYAAEMKKIAQAEALGVDLTYQKDDAQKELNKRIEAAKLLRETNLKTLTAEYRVMETGIDSLTSGINDFFDISSAGWNNFGALAENVLGSMSRQITAINMEVINGALKDVFLGNSDLSSLFSGDSGMALAGLGIQAGGQIIGGAIAGDDARAQRNSQTGAMIGTIGGMAIGSQIGAIGGPLGAAIGAAVGAIIGALFKSSESSSERWARKLAQIHKELDAQSKIMNIKYDAQISLLTTIAQDGHGLSTQIKKILGNYDITTEKVKGQFTRSLGDGLRNNGAGGVFNTDFYRVFEQAGINPFTVSTPEERKGTIFEGQAPHRADYNYSAILSADIETILEASKTVNVYHDLHWSQILQNYSNEITVFAQNLLESLKPVIEMGTQLATSFEEITGSSKFTKQKLQIASDAIQDLIGDNGLLAFLDENAARLIDVEKIYRDQQKFAYSGMGENGVIENFTGQELLSYAGDDEDTIRAKQEHFAAIADSIGLTVSQTEALLNNKDALKLMSDALATSTHNIDAWLGRNETAEASIRRLAEQLGNIDLATMPLNEAFTLMSDDIDGLTDQELSLLQAREAAKDSLQALTDDYVSMFYTEEEQVAISLVNLQESMMGVGDEAFRSSDEFVAFMDALASGSDNIDSKFRILVDSMNAAAVSADGVAGSMAAIASMSTSSGATDVDTERQLKENAAAVKAFSDYQRRVQREADQQRRNAQRAADAANKAHQKGIEDAIKAEEKRRKEAEDEAKRRMAEEEKRKQDMIAQDKEVYDRRMALAKAEYDFNMDILDRIESAYTGQLSYLNSVEKIAYLESLAMTKSDMGDEGGYLNTLMTQLEYEKKISLNREEYAAKFDNYINNLQGAEAEKTTTDVVISIEELIEQTRRVEDAINRGSFQAPII